MDSTAYLLTELGAANAELHRLRDEARTQRQRADKWRSKWNQDFARKRVSLMCGRCGCIVSGNPVRTKAAA